MQKNKLEAIYLIYGENELKNYLRSEGYQNKVINFMVPHVREGALRNQSKYQEYIDKVELSRRGFMNVTDELGIPSSIESLNLRNRKRK